ncbi:MAG: protein translocase subunit SecF [Gammaproteobacteria bacterium]|nr:protein translocase subunit SecF [Gammaproteobacteria bacterium]
MELFHKVSTVRFMEMRRYWYALSVLLIIGSLALVAFKGMNFGQDFTGGVVVEAAYKQPVDLEKTRATLVAAGLTEAQVQNFGTANDLLVRLPPAEGKEVAAVTDRVSAALKSLDPSVEIKRTESIGPQVGKELAEKGSMALLMTLLFIGVYVLMRFQLKFAGGAILAALHDPIVVVGFFALTGMTFDLAAVSAILAVIGYSLNDTVVVFDRVRERMLSMRQATPIEVMNAAINETLSRTLITSGVTLLTVIALFVLGGEALRGFSAALLVGIVVGTYSSIYVAGAIALDSGLSQKDLMPASEKPELVDDMP